MKFYSVVVCLKIQESIAFKLHKVINKRKKPDTITIHQFVKLNLEAHAFFHLSRIC